MDNVRTEGFDAETERKTREELIKDVEAIKERLLQMKGITDDYIRSTEALKLDEERLEALSRLYDMYDASEHDIIDFSLESAIRLTGSKVGWMGALGPDERTIIMYCWSGPGIDMCDIRDTTHAMRIEEGGIWVEPIIQRKPLIINDYRGSSLHKKGYPGGHIDLRRFMGVPIYDGARIVAVAEVGNKDTDYDRSDLRQLTLLMSGVWHIIMRKRAESEMLESRSQSDLYVDLMSHDINNLNQVAIGFIELALDHIDLEGSLSRSDKHLLEKPIEALRNSAKLIDNVKKLQRIRKGALITLPVDIGQALDDAVSEFSGNSGREISIRHASIKGYYVKANELLKDIFSNIIGNSIRHSSADMPLYIDINVTKQVMDGLDHYVVSIEDNGPGICDSRKEAIFDRFELYKNHTLSSGFGLSLVKALVDAYQGKVWIEDRMAGDHTKGCRFVLALPVLTM